jgi:tRNA nucleotidyltransferase (CCA-adding enzyme)
MARRADVYPQVSPPAADLVDGAVVAAPAALAAADGARLARRRGAEVLVAGPGGWVLREDAGRADALGVGDLPLRRLARPLPVVPARASEIVVRRHLAAGAPAVVVVRGRVPLGVVRRSAPAPVLSMQARLRRWLDPDSLTLLATVNRLAAAHGARAFAVGGLVRDAWRGGAPAGRDLDLVIEGDAPLVARALAAELDGTLVEHERFLTASVELPSGRRIDLVTARTERYEAPGALPRVLPGSIDQDLRRRDFTVNAMAVELASETYGLLDPLGGAADLAARRLRILHPLSFVEDPTRIFRAVRYAARLGFALDPWSARARTLALELAPYPALSPARIVAELERLLADAAPDRTLVALARAGAFRLLAPGHRVGRATLARLTALPATLAWARRRGVAVPAVEVLAVALAVEQAAAVAAAVPRALGLGGAGLERVHETLAAHKGLEARLAGARRPSEAARLVRAASPTLLAWLRLAGTAATGSRLDRIVTAEQGGRPMLSGEDVLRLGVPRGPEVAAALAALRDARLDGEIRERQGEIDYVRTWVQTRTPKEG